MPRTPVSGCGAGTPRVWVQSCKGALTPGRAPGRSTGYLGCGLWATPTLPHGALLVSPAHPVPCGTCSYRSPRGFRGTARPIRVVLLSLFL